QMILLNVTNVTVWVGFGYAQMINVSSK
ncbi:MAG: hypothetical protein PWQ06_2020, partial [Anaerophaga sp.]|nr:hypothetical protein [Anaerophaga sp.]